MRYLCVRSRLLVWVVVGVLGGSLAWPAAAQTDTPPDSWAVGDRAVVTADYLNVRSEPRPDAPLVGTLVKGSNVTLVAMSAAEPNWVQIQGEDQAGWVSTRWLDPVGVPPETTPSELVVTSARLPSVTATPTQTPPLPTPRPTSRGDVNFFSELIATLPGATDEERINYYIATLTRSQLGVWFLIALAAGVVVGRRQANRHPRSKARWALNLIVIWVGVGALIALGQFVTVDSSNVLGQRLAAVAGGIFAVTAILFSWLGIWSTSWSLKISDPGPDMTWDDYNRMERDEEKYKDREPKRSWLEDMIIGDPPKRQDDDDG